MKNYGNRKMWGNPRTKECFKDYRCFDESKWLLSKQNGVTERNRSQERHSHRRKVLSDDRAKHSGIPNYCGQSKGGGQSRYRSRWSDCQLTADALRLQQSICVPKKKLWYRRKEPVIGGRKSCWRKCKTADSKGACWARDQNLWYPRRLRVPSLNKIAQTADATVSFMGISRSESFPGFNRYTTEWKSPPNEFFSARPGWNALHSA